MAASTRPLLSSSVRRAVGSTDTRTSGFLATRTTFSMVSEWPSRTQSDGAIARSCRHHHRDSTPAAGLSGRAPPPDQQLGISGVGLERPIEYEKAGARMGHPNRPIAKEGVAGFHLEHVAQARAYFYRRVRIPGAGVGVRSGQAGRIVDAGQIGDGIDRVELDPGAGAARREPQLTGTIPIHVEVDVDRGAFPHPAQLTILDQVVAVIVPEPKAAAIGVFLNRVDHLISAVR